MIAKKSNTIYVKYNGVLGIPDPVEVKKLNLHLESMGLKNWNIISSDVGEKIVFLMQQKFVAISYEKKGFVGATENNYSQTISQDEFMNQTKGRVANKKFMGFL